MKRTVIAAAAALVLLCTAFGAGYSAGAIAGDCASGQIADWVQAVGTVLAIFAAIGLALFQHQLESRGRREENHLRAQAVAAAIYQDVLHIAEIALFASQDAAERIRDGKAVGLFAAYRDQHYIPQVEVLVENADKFYLFGPRLAGKLLALLSEVRAYNRKLDSYIGPSTASGFVIGGRGIDLAGLIVAADQVAASVKDLKIDLVHFHPEIVDLLERLD